MKVLSRHITRKLSGGVAVRDESFETDLIVFGRATTCNVELPDPRVLLQHAQIVRRSNHYYVEVLAGESISVNGLLTYNRQLNELDKLHIGPYEIIVQPPKGESEITLSIELKTPQDNDLESLIARSKVNVDNLGISKRQLSWAMFTLVIAAFLIVPLIDSLTGDVGRYDLRTGDRSTLSQSFTTVWNTGELSGVHRFFGNSCEVCHVQPFVPVRDADCLSCHPRISHHADPQTFTFAAFEDVACQGCHKEHHGEVSIARSDQEFCAECHRDLTDRATNTSLQNVSDFAVDHPDFKPSVIRDVGLNIVDRQRSMSSNPFPVENPGLSFNHVDHLRSVGVKHPTRGNIQLECGDCHVSDNGNVSMLPISFEEHCHECHLLRFDTQLAGRELLHGDSEALFAQIKDTYQAVAMRGGYREPEAPLVLRRRPGTPLSETEKKVALDWAASKAQDVLDGRFGRGLCEECHQVSDNASSSTWSVDPVYISAQWFPKATFNHRMHTASDCGMCHAVETSISAHDVLMPSIETCRSCHGSDRDADRVPTTCIDCHRFHRDDLDLMRPVNMPAAPFEATEIRESR